MNQPHEPSRFLPSTRIEGPPSEPDANHEQRMKYFHRKGSNFRRATTIGGNIGADVLNQRMPMIRTVELQGAHRIVQNIQGVYEGRGSRVVEKLRGFIAQDRPSTKEYVDLIDTSAEHLLRNAKLESFDIVDVVIGTHAFDTLTRNLLADERRDADRGGIVEGTRNALVENVMIRLLDQIPLGRTAPLLYREVDEITTQTFGKEAALHDKLRTRLSNATFEAASVIGLVSPHVNQSYDRKMMRKLTTSQRELLSSLAEREGVHQMPTLVLQGADIGLDHDIIMGHPDSYGIPLREHESVLCDFFLTTPKEVHRLPTITRQYTGYSVSFGNEQVMLALRLFKNGEVDFGWPLLCGPHRTIDNTFRQLKANDGLVYMKSLLTSLVADASAPPEVIERQGEASVPKILGEAIGREAPPGELAEIMTRVVIPRRIEVTRRPQRDAEEKGSTGSSSPKRWHQVRASANSLPEGYSRSEQNLQKYLWDLAQGNIFPLSPEDDRAIREGTKYYMPRRARGNKELGEVVAHQAVLGEGAAKQVLRNWEELAATAEESDTEQ